MTSTLSQLLRWLTPTLSTRRGGRRHWSVQALESKVCLTGSFASVDSVLEIQLTSPGEQLVIRQESNDHVFQLLSGPWNGTDIPGMTGHGLSELRFSEMSAFRTIRIRDTASDCQIIFSGATAQQFGSSLSIELTENPAPLFVNSPLEFLDSASMAVRTSGALIVASTGGIRCLNGDTTLSSGRGFQTLSSHGSGITVSGGYIQSAGTGSIAVDGIAGALQSDYLNGVVVSGGGRIIGSAIGSVHITGEGADGAADPSHGVLVTGANSQILTLGGSVLIRGLGGSACSSMHHVGVQLDGGGRVSVTGAGTLTVEGAGGNSSAGFNRGVMISGDLSAMSSVNGDISIRANGGGSDAGTHNSGFLIDAGGGLMSTGRGNISVIGSGSAATGEFHRGVLLTGQNSRITAQSGSIRIEGYGGGTENSSGNAGVMLDASAFIRTESGALLQITGFGGSGRGDENRGVLISGSDTSISTGSGNIEVTGQGGGIGTSQWNYGVSIESGATIGAASHARVVLQGAGGTGSGLWNRGVVITSATSHVTAGQISITGATRVVNGIVSHGFFLDEGAFLNATGSVPEVHISSDTATIGNLSFIDSGQGLCTIGPVTVGRPLSLSTDKSMEPENLVLSPEELGRMIAGSIEAGGANAGPVFVRDDLVWDNPISLSLYGSRLELFCSIINTDTGRILFRGNSQTDVIFQTQSLQLKSGSVQTSGIRGFCFDASMLSGTEPVVTTDCWLPLSGVELVLTSADAVSAGTFCSLIRNPGTLNLAERFRNSDVNNYIDVSEQSMIQIVNNSGDGNDTGFTVLRGQRPWFAPINDITIAEDSPMASVSIGGIRTGAGFGAIRLTAIPSESLLEQMTVDYQDSASTALIRFRPTSNLFGTATVTVRAESAGRDGDLNTTPDNVVFERTFRVTVQQMKPRITGPESISAEQSPVLKWTSVPGALKYEVWINNLSTGAKSVYRASTNDTRHIPTIAMGIGRFEFWVRAWKTQTAALPWSLAYRFQINTRCEILPLQSRIASCFPEISWKPLPGAARYDLWIDDVSGKRPQVVRETRLTTTSWTSSLPLPISRYRIWVRGIDASGTIAAWSQLKDLQVAPAPERISPMYSTFDNQPDFIWKPVPGAAAYSLMIAESDTGRKVLQQDGITATHWKCTQALPDGYYRWWVMATSAAGFRADWTVPCEIYVGGRSRILSPMGTLTANQPRFEWQHVDGAASYQLWVNREDVAQARIINTAGIQETSWQTNQPLPAGSYRAWVRAISVSGKAGPWSRDMTFRIASGEDRPRVTPDQQLLEMFAEAIEHIPRQSRESVQAIADSVYENTPPENSADGTPRLMYGGLVNPEEEAFQNTATASDGKEYLPALAHSLFSLDSI